MPPSFEDHQIPAPALPLDFGLEFSGCVDGDVGILVAGDEQRGRWIGRNVVEGRKIPPVRLDTLVLIAAGAVVDDRPLPDRALPSPVDWPESAVRSGLVVGFFQEGPEFLDLLRVGGGEVVLLSDVFLDIVELGRLGVFGRITVAGVPLGIDLFPVAGLGIH